MVLCVIRLEDAVEGCRVDSVMRRLTRSEWLPGTIAHGMLDMAILAEAVARWAGAHDRVIELACRFSKPLLPGDTVTCTGRVASVDHAAGTATLQLEATSSRGERVLPNGRAVVRLAG